MRTPDAVIDAVRREAPGPEWLRAVARGLLRDLAPLEQILDTWGLSSSEAAALLGVSRQAFSKWLRSGVPPDRRPAVSTLAAATDELLRNLKPERIAAVVRRPAPALDGRSLLQLARAGDMQAVYDRVRELFDLGRVGAVRPDGEPSRCRDMLDGYPVLPEDLSADAPGGPTTSMLGLPMLSLSPLCARWEPVLPLPPSGLTVDDWALIHGDEFAEWMTMEAEERWRESRRLWDAFSAIREVRHADRVARSDHEGVDGPEPARGAHADDGRLGERGLRRLGV